MPEQEKPPIESLDDYANAVTYLMKTVLFSGDGHGLRALKTVMDSREEMLAAIQEHVKTHA